MTALPSLTPKPATAATIATAQRIAAPLALVRQRPAGDRPLCADPLLSEIVAGNCRRLIANSFCRMRSRPGMQARTREPRRSSGPCNERRNGGYQRPVRNSCRKVSGPLSEKFGFPRRPRTRRGRPETWRDGRTRPVAITARGRLDERAGEHAEELVDPEEVIEPGRQQEDG